MRKYILLAAVAALSACQKQAEAPAANEAAPVTETTTAATPMAMSLLGTTWEFTRDGKDLVESIDSSGNYITETKAGEHYDHGTYAEKAGKACFTSAMTQEGETCWTVEDVPVGETATTTSDKGETLEVKHVAYKEMKMPA